MKNLSYSALESNSYTILDLKIREISMLGILWMNFRVEEGLYIVNFQGQDLKLEIFMVFGVHRFFSVFNVFISMISKIKSIFIIIFVPALPEMLEVLSLGVNTKLRFNPGM